MHDVRLDDGETTIGIALMARRSGLSQDTLRWYEKEGLLPHVGRRGDGRRQYGPRDQGLVRLLATLRATGMPSVLMREFVALLGEGAASHGRRIGVLDQTRSLLEDRRQQIDDALTALDAKVAHYRGLIEAGLDCDGLPVPEATRPAQRSTTPLTSKESA